VGKIEPASSPPIQKKGSWGSWRELPHHLYRIRPRGEAGVNCPTTYTEDGLVGKLVNVRNLHPLSSPPPIQKMASWGSWGQLPHHLYRRRARGEVSKRPQLTPPIFPTTYTEEGLVGKLGSTSPPPIQKKASWGSWGQLPHHLYRRRARGEVSKRPQLTPPYLPHHLYRKRPRGEARVNCLTTYTEDGLVGKLVIVRNLHPLSSPPPIQKEASWGSSHTSADYLPPKQRPHHL